jgi:soluble lytic murein transglycosylase
VALRRLLLALALLLTLALSDHGGAPALLHARAQEIAAPFDPEVVRPAAGSALALALEALRAADPKSAEQRATEGLRDASLTEAMLLRWLGARAAREQGRLAESVALAAPLASSDHVLAPWAGLLLVQLLEGSDATRALEHAELLRARGLDGWPGRAELERLRAKLLGKLGRTDEAIAELTRLCGSACDIDSLARPSAGFDSAPLQVLVPLADLLAPRSEPEKVRALAMYRSVAARVPLTKLGRRAEEQAKSVLASLPEPLRTELREPALATRLTRADALLADLRYGDAEGAYDALEREVAGDARLHCRVRFGRAKALIDRRAREQGAALMAELAERCVEDVEQRAWARYHAGRAFSALGKNDLALAQYEALEREAPAHRLADDALFRAAKVARDMKDAAGARTRLEALPARYPQGDMAPRARFALAWHAHGQGQLAEAVEILSQGNADEPAEDTQGRSAYFRGRFLEQLGQKRAAADAFAALCASYPLSYYGLQAHSRLSALDPARARAARAAFDATLVPLTFERRPELEQVGFARAVALLSAGDVDDALAELRALGFLEPSADAELAWLGAALLDRAGAPHAAVDLARRHMRALLGRAPRGRDLALYRLVYPQAFSPLIEDSASREGVPSAFVRAVAREESGFYPGAVSRAHARGLIQLIEPTAKAIAKGMGLPAHPEALAQPEVNLALGTRFISTLAGNLRGQYALVPVAYNAGPSVTSRWLNERPTEPLDVWVENIPYDETRHYTRRVLQSYGVYHFLATGELLALPLELPAL